jgi:chromosome partitioning protein
VIPRDVSRQLRPSQAAGVISITSLKGGVGKSPITVDVASCLAERGYKVAVITYDYSYESEIMVGSCPRAESLVSKLDFYGYADVFFSNAERLAFKSRILNILDNDMSADRSRFEFEMGGSVESMAIRLARSNLFKDIKKEYDYVFLDINQKVELIRAKCDLVAIIVDSTCSQSVDSALRLGKRLRSTKGRVPKCFGLITRNDVGGRSRELEEFCGRLDLSLDAVAGLEEGRFSSLRYRERILNDITALPFLRLNTHLTNSHELAIDYHNIGRDLMDGYGYFDSVLDFAPKSYAADEMRRLTNELVDLRL